MLIDQPTTVRYDGTGLKFGVIGRKKTAQKLDFRDVGRGTNDLAEALCTLYDYLRH